MTEQTNIFICKVIKVLDDHDGLRIRARIPYFDHDIPDDQLPYAFPLMPKFLHVNPKIGECVLIFTQAAGKPSTDRFFIGPLISQPYMMPFDPYETSARKLLQGASETLPYPKVDMEPGNVGTLPQRDDIAIEGRCNTEIVLKDEEIRLRCGYKKEPRSGVITDRLLRNDINPAYIQIKHGPMPSNAREANGLKAFGDGGLINIVADKINLLTHDSPTFFDMHDKIDLINDEELEKVFKNAHPLVYGDVLVAYLKELVKVFKEHIHTFAYNPPSFDLNQKKVFDHNLDKELLSKNILIN